ncbi:YciI family protein [Nonomuraea purpurea]|uniref:YciI family protein n=1 Tax=Nonomuraea purpurea TaxID=1849276 RepID=A0ABV8G8V8_9ACTN
MKYIILSYASQQEYDAMGGNGADLGLKPEDFGPMYAWMDSFNQSLADSGELVETRALAAPVHTRRVGGRDGVPYVTDGPYAETQEVLAGYWIVECDSFDRATQIAARLGECPAPPQLAANAYADVRPLAEAVQDLEV